MNQSLDIQNSYNIYDVLNKNCMDYSRYVLKYRCIPDLRDGCKPIHKRIIYSFYKNKLTYDKSRAKSCNACGGVLAYSPHGDSSVYDASVRLANDSVNINLIDGKGSFSSYTSRDIEAGASRYTEMRLSQIANELLQGIDKENVDFVATYDEARLEPTVLPAKFPLILCNPSIGIGVGISCSIASFNINEVIDYTNKYIKGEETDLLSPDFPTGGIYLYDENELKAINDTGRGKLVIRAKYHFENDSIVVTEIPYTTTREAICEKVLELIQNKAIKEIVDVNDYTGVKGLNITIDLKKNSNCETVMAKLFAKTPLQDNFSCNFNVLDNCTPKLLGIKNIISKWVVFRKETVLRELKYDLNTLIKEKSLLDGLVKILDVIDDIINIIKRSENDNDSIEKLVNKYDLTVEQAEYIINIKLKNLNKEWLKNKTEKIKELYCEINNLSLTISDGNKINSIIISQLENIKSKYGKPRKTEILYEHEQPVITKEDLIDNYNHYITLTQQNYLKKTKLSSDNHKLKDGDNVTQQIQCTNKSDILLFTDKGNLYTIKSHTLQLLQPSVLGVYLPTLIQFEENEKIIHMTTTEDYIGDMLIVFESGKVGKVTMKSYRSTRQKLTKALSILSKVVFMAQADDNKYLLMESKSNKLLIVDHLKLNVKDSKNTQGANCISNGCKFAQFISKDTDNVDYYLGSVNSAGKAINKIKQIDLDK